MSTESSTVCTVHRTQHPGNSAVAIRDDGRIAAISGWDGKFVTLTYEAFDSSSLTTFASEYVYTRPKHSSHSEHLRSTKKHARLWPSHTILPYYHQL
jgi:hypothetical protein